MRIERISKNKFKIFITYDDLIERGFTKEDIWKDLKSVKSLFTQMMHEASKELDFELEGILLVQVRFLQAQGMYIYVTKQKDDKSPWWNDFVEMKVTLNESKEILFEFEQFEHLIQASSYLYRQSVHGGVVYHLNNTYYLLLKEIDIIGVNKEAIIAILSEFASPSIVSEHRLKSCGKQIIEKDAIHTIHYYFD